MEIWKDIKDTNGKYQASSHGRVRSNAQILKCQEDAKQTYIRSIKGQKEKDHESLFCIYPRW